MSKIIDEFCTQFNISNTELATLLGVKQPQVASWKSGKRDIPEKHKEKLYEVFNIPHDKRYLLDLENADEILKLEIELIHLNYLNVSVDEVALVKSKINLEKNIYKIREYLQNKNNYERNRIVEDVFGVKYSESVFNNEMINEFNKKLKENNSILQIKLSDCKKDIIEVILTDDQLIENYNLIVGEQFSELIKVFFKSRYKLNIQEINSARIRYQQIE